MNASARWPYSSALHPPPRPVIVVEGIGVDTEFEYSADVDVRGVQELDLRRRTCGGKIAN
eukprot:IDg22990t1